VLRDAGYHAVYRDAVDGGHWPGETTAGSVHSRALRSAQDGGVVVFHTNRAETPEALPGILADLRAAGFRLGPLSALGRIPSPRLDRHPDFADLEFRQGYVRPAQPGRWQSIPLVELAAAATQPPNAVETVATLAGTSLDLVTGDPAEPLGWCCDRSDRYVLVLAGAVRCEFRAHGEDAGYVLARPGELVLCPASVDHRLASAAGRRWIAITWRTEDP
jgi:hypothetical protein